MLNAIRRTVAVLAVAALSFTVLAPAAGAAEREFCVIVGDWTIICLDP